MSKAFRIKSISQFHQLRGLPKPAHPLISVVNIEDITLVPQSLTILDFYCISIKRTGGVTYQ
jgi:AraC family transcriptional activator of pobA